MLASTSGRIMLRTATSLGGKTALRALTARAAGGFVSSTSSNVGIKVGWSWNRYLCASHNFGKIHTCSLERRECDGACIICCNQHWLELREISNENALILISCIHLSMYTSNRYSFATFTSLNSMFYIRRATPTPPTKRGSIRPIRSPTKAPSLISPRRPSAMSTMYLKLSLVPRPVPKPVSTSSASPVRRRSTRT